MEYKYLCYFVIEGIMILVMGSMGYNNVLGTRGTTEFCDEENFRAECSHGEMILMEKASFGRMKVGRCVKRDMGFLGCHINVLSQMDKLCSGKQRCEIPNLGKSKFDNVESLECTELQLYLEAGFSCIRALESRDICRTSDHSLLLKDSPAFVYTPTLQSVPCLARHLDIIFKVTASMGQQINISMVDLEVDSTSRWQRCADYGGIVELKTMQLTVICGQQERRKNLLVSNSNAVEIRIDGQQKAKFMLEFAALGCADIPGPSLGWKERRGNKLTLGCYNSKQTWQLTCEGNRWAGVIGNCSSDSPKAASSKEEPGHTHSISPDVLLALIIACGVIVAVSSITFGVVCWRRRTLEAEIAKVKATGKPPNSKNVKNRLESEYMFPNFRPRSTMSETEDAVYDFCFSPGSTQGTLPNNMTSSVTLPCRSSASIQYNNMVPYPAPPESPKYKTLVVVKG